MATQLIHLFILLFITISHFTCRTLANSNSNVIHGFSAILSDSELQKVQEFPGYVSSYRDMNVKLDTTYSSKFLGLNVDNGAWPKSKYGSDVIIGFVDTGVWPESESFNDYGMSEVPSKWKGQCEVGITGPGDYILAAWPPDIPSSHLRDAQAFSDFNILSCTSMSCPHLAGVAALLKQAHPEWSPATIRSAMMTSSDILDSSLQPIQDVASSSLYKSLRGH